MSKDVEVLPSHPLQAPELAKLRRRNKELVAGDADVKVRALLDEYRLDHQSGKLNFKSRKVRHLLDVLMDNEIWHEEVVRILAEWMTSPNPKQRIDFAKFVFSYQAPKMGPLESTPKESDKDDERRETVNKVRRLMHGQK